jgi:DUF438 domain-containing protein
MESKKLPNPLSPQLLMNQMAVALTVLDLEGAMVYYNEPAARMLDRKPSYIGHDIRAFHKPASNERIEAILQAYAQGETREFAWQLERGDTTFAVRVAPLILEDKPAGLVHTVMLLSRPPAGADE